MYKVFAHLNTDSIATYGWEAIPFFASLVQFSPGLFNREQLFLTVSANCTGPENEKSCYRYNIKGMTFSASK